MGAFMIDINDLGRTIIIDRTSITDYFTDEEQVYCSDRIESYAGRFTAKIAIMQALGGEDIDPLEISIGSLPSKQPIARIEGSAGALLGNRNISVSISHDANLAIAMAILSPNSTPIGIGADVASVERIYKAIEKHGEKFFKRQFTQKEKKDLDGDIVKITQKWAAKESLAKALGTGFWKEGVAWTDVEILSEEKEETVELSGGALQKAKSLGFTNWKIYSPFRENEEAQIAFALIR